MKILYYVISSKYQELNQKLRIWIWKNLKLNREFRLKNIDEIRNYLIAEINRNELMGKKHKKSVGFWIIMIPRLLQFLQLLNVFPFPFLHL